MNLPRKVDKEKQKASEGEIRKREDMAQSSNFLRSLESCCSVNLPGQVYDESDKTECRAFLPSIRGGTHLNPWES